jgi:DNA-binding transcriptional LysR family regulator
MAKLDLNLMAVLEAIYDEGNTSRAAEALHLSQSAVSHALNRLRSIYNDPLFSRQGHTMMPSPLTERIITQVKHGLGELRRSVDDAHHFDPSLHQHLFRISQREVLETELLAPLIVNIEKQAPRIRIHSTHSSPHTIIEKLHLGQVDTCIELAMPMPDHIHQVPLIQETLVVVGRKDHPYFQQPQTDSAFLSYPQILVTPFQDELEFIDHTLARQGTKRDVVLRCQNYSSAIQVLLHSDKLSIMPRGFTRSLPSDTNIATGDIPFESPLVEMHLYWHERHQHDPAHRWLRQQLVNAADSIDVVDSIPGALELVS